MSKQKRTTRLVAAGIVACVLAAAVLVYVNRSGSSAGSPLAFAAPVASLDEAVSRGMVGQNAVDALRADGSVDLVASFELPSFDAPGASPAAQATTDPQVSDLIDQLMAAYASVKQGAYGDVAGIEVLDELQALPNATLRVSDENALLALLSAPGVIGVSQPRTYDTLDNEGVPIVNADDTAAAGNVGAGTTVAVLDSGADYTNAAFGSCTAPNAPEGTCAVTFWKQYGTKQDEKLDESGHGTNVAGIVHAVAPGADILALDVFHPVLDENGQTKQSAEDTDILAALNDLILWKQQGTPIVSANMSLGSGGFSTEACTQQTNDDGTVEPNPYVSTFASMRQVGILPVVASGNDAGGGLLGTPEAGISSPACTPGAVSVGAVYVGAYEILEWSGCTDIVTHVDQVTCFSQTGPNLSMLAPGSQINAAGITQSGTSQAAPHVAGAAAVLKAAVPNATIDQIEAALVNSGPVIEDTRTGTSYSKHRLDVQAALVALGGGTTTVGDTTAPTVGTVGVSIDSTDTTDGYATARLQWSATDDIAVTGYYLWVSSDGGAFTQISLPTPTSADVTVDVMPGHTFTFAVQAVDAANNGSQFSYTAATAV